MDKAQWRRFAAIGATALAIAAMPMTGCGGGEEEAEAAAAPKPFPTSTSMVDEFNRIMARPMPDLSELAGVMYAEKEGDKKLVEMFRKCGPVCPLARASVEAFGQSDFAGKDGMGFECESAVANGSSDRRATATYWFKGDKKKSRTLQLVEVGDRWWVSSLTFEDNSKLDRIEDLKNIDAIFMAIGMYAGMGEAFGATADQLVTDIKSGKIKPESELKVALQAAAPQKSPSRLK